MLGNVVTANQVQVTRLDHTIATASRSLEDAQASLETLRRRRRFRHLDQYAIEETQHRVNAHDRLLGRLHNERARWAARLDVSQRRLHEAERAVDRIPEVEAAIARRSDWLLSHPAELAWEADLATRIAARTKELDSPPAGDEQPQREHHLEALLRSIDLRTIDLPAHPPRTGIGRTTSKALGLSRRTDGADIALPPLPGHGLDRGPDLGL